MGTNNYSDEFKRDAVHQITVRGYPTRNAACVRVHRTILQPETQTHEQRHAVAR